MGSGTSGRTVVRRVYGFALIIVGVLAPSIAQAQFNPPLTAGVAGASPAELGISSGRTRFVIGLERAVDFQVSSIPNPNRVFVDLPDVRMQLPAHSGNGPIGLVKSFNGGQSAPGRTRIVIDVTMPVIVESAKIETPRDGKHPRLVLEIVAADGSQTGAKRTAIPAPSGLGARSVAAPPMPKMAQRPKTRDAGMYKPVIVIDPGHGGHDSGATKYGTVEKAVVLAFSLKLRDKLLASGRYKVLMTRETDVFVPLDDRRAFGDQHRAALFIAVHADYAGSSARGATIYSLREATSDSLQRSAKADAGEKVLTTKELDGVRRSNGDVNAVTNILQSLAEREIAANKRRTDEFSRSVINFMGASTPMQNNPDREANFRVLKSAKTPSVLIELAYVTNQQDAQNLRSDSWRDKVSTSLVTAVHNYFTHQVAQLPY